MMKADPPIHQPLAALALAAALTACGDSPPPITGRVLDETFESAIVGDTYRILVRLPPGYDDEPSLRYPVVYQLDATSFGPQFDITAGLASELAAEGEVPEVIVVGVGYPYEAGFGEPRGRWRDYRTELDDGSPGGAPEFLRFLREELLPYVDATYRTDVAAGRTLGGHSLGGFFALYSMLTTGAEAEPPFARFVAADPSLGEDDAELFALEAELGAGALDARLHFSMARYTGAVQRLYFEALSERLAEHHPDLAMRAEILETDHGGAIQPAYRDGLRFVLGGGR